MIKASQSSIIPSFLPIRSSECPFAREEELTKDFGFVKFDTDPSLAASSLSYYMRLALKTPNESILELIEKGFHLSKPNLIISITGGAKHFHLSPRLNRAFEEGLIQAAKTTSNRSRSTSVLVSEWN